MPSTWERIIRLIWQLVGGDKDTPMQIIEYSVVNKVWELKQKADKNDTSASH